VSFHAICKQGKPWDQCDLDTADPALFEVHMKDRHKRKRDDVGKPDAGDPSSFRLPHPLYEKRFRLTPTEREWLGANVRAHGREGQVFAQSPAHRCVWVTDGRECWEVHVSDLERVSERAA